MNRKWAFLIGLFPALLGGPTLLAALPVVSNVVAAQQPGSSKLVDIHYDLIDDGAGDLGTVWVLASNDGGTTWNVPVVTLQGTGWGPNISPGVNKYIVS